MDTELTTISVWKQISPKRNNIGEDLRVVYILDDIKSDMIPEQVTYRIVIEETFVAIRHVFFLDMRYIAYTPHPTSRDVQLTSDGQHMDFEYTETEFLQKQCTNDLYVKNMEPIRSLKVI